MNDYISIFHDYYKSFIYIFKQFRIAFSESIPSLADKERP